MSLTITTARSAPTTAELVGVGVFSDKDRPKGLPDDALDSRGFEGTLGKTMIVGSAGGEGRRRLLLVTTRLRRATR